MIEEWRDVVGFEGLYQVSNLGRVKSLDRYVHMSASHKAVAYKRFVKGCVLRPGASNYGHLSVVLGRNKTRMVHDLVMRAFVGPPPPKHECCHNNGDPKDNRLSNLRWGTRSENNFDAVRHGTRGKLTAQQVADIRAQLKNETRGLQSALARQYGVALCTINSIKFNRVYTQV